MKVSELTGSALDDLVARALGYKSRHEVSDELCGTWYVGESDGGVNEWNPSQNWFQAGPIIEREQIATQVNPTSDLYDAWGERPAPPTEWVAKSGLLEMAGPTLLVAAMRCFVARKFGNAVQI